MATLLSTAEVARVLRIHQVSAARVIREGQLPALKVGKTWIIREEDLEAVARNYNNRRGRRPRPRERGQE